jgi:precorrin-2 methylase
MILTSNKMVFAPWLLVVFLFSFERVHCFRSLCAQKHSTQIFNSVETRIQSLFALSTTSNTEEGNQKWENAVTDEFGERIESVKAAAFAAIGGKIVFASYICV